MPRDRAHTHGALTARRQLADLSIIEARHEPHTVLPLHAHPLSCVIGVLAGSFEEAFEGRIQQCHSGDMLLRPADASHANAFGNAGATYLIVEIPAAVLSGLANREGALSRIRQLRHPHPSAALRRIRDAAHAASVPDLEELLLDALGSVGGDAEDDGRCTVGVPPAWLQRVHDRIRDEFPHRPSVPELAREAGVHADHVCRQFRRHFGFTISDMVRQCRVEYAARAIRAASLPLTQVAYEAGFSDQSHMTRQMIRHLGVTPQQLRWRTAP